MTIMKNFIRGGQLSVHTYQMIKQITLVSLFLGLLVGIGMLGFLFIKNTSSYERYIYHQYLYAEFKTTINSNDPSQSLQDFTYGNGEIRKIRSIDILKDPFVLQTVARLDGLIFKLAVKASLYAFFFLSLLILFFAYRGHVKSLKKLERGNRILPAKQLAKVIQRRKQASDLNLDGLPLLKDKETSHILITGTTGAGKSNCLNTLLPQIRARGDKAIVVDLNGTFVERYYTDSDSILNPLDFRSQNWLPWADCKELSHYDHLSAALVPKSNAHDTFWENAGKVLLSTALKQTKDEPDIEKLYYLLAQEDLSVFSQFFRGTEAATYTHMDGEKMTLSIRATLANQIQCFQLLKPTQEAFSVRDWVADSENKSWLFLSARPDQRTTLRPLISAWLDTAINALMSRSLPCLSRIWFVIDELPALNKLPSLETAMAEARKYGGCMLAGVQSFPQLVATYGSNPAQSILDLFNTKIFFRNTDPNTNTWISKVIGEAEITEHVENVSYGANTIRDGVSLSQQNRTKPLLLPSEIANFEDLEAVIKLPGDYPVGRLKMGYRG